ncbi:MAG: hypothetical protein ACREQ5_24820 [Candidatus Dormibacteria bacterium]
MPSASGDTDKVPVGDVGDYLFFAPRRLWIGSSNFTFNSRHSLEFGMGAATRRCFNYAKGAWSTS